ncbi:MAG: DUF4125 family protein [Lachnospiraceae bacterium]|nr:DUF4125 family protein [Lachnospiraceae bacterium]
MSKSVDVDAIMQKVYEYFAKNQGANAEKLLQNSILDAVKIGDDGSLLQLLNELLGYYRETSRVEDSYAIARQCMNVMARMGIENTIPYATTLLNVANAYRAGGRLEDSLQLYLKVREIYDAKLTSDDMLMASLENNLSLLYQELGQFEDAKESLLRALRIVETKTGVDFEIAVTHANLATSCLNIGEIEEACAYAKASIREFDAIGVEDAHYGAALSALATYHYRKKNYADAYELFEKAMNIMERSLGKNEFYERLKENAQACKIAQNKAIEEMNDVGQGQTEEKMNDSGYEQAVQKVSGLSLSRAFYDKYGRPMIAEKFPDYESKIAVGLVGKGSDCFGYDDMLSTDHDWGPEFCMWVTEETYEAIGEQLEAAYEELPDEFEGYGRMEKNVAKERRGVFVISEFFNKLVGAPDYENVDWRQVEDYALAAVTNGEIFRDDEGVFTLERNKFLAGYPENIFYLKLADSAARFSQTGQYNYKRMLDRDDQITALIMMADCSREAMKLQHYIDGTYPPHDKWLHRSMQKSENGSKLAELLSGLPDTVEEIGTVLADELYSNNFISDTDNYLDAHSNELSMKAAFAEHNDEWLVNQIAEVEFKAFDKVKNVGGRASCQNDWPTFSIMRKSQYMTWNRTMLIQYLYDFVREFSLGHNLIEEKYGRMMESTAPEEYETIKEHFPVITPEKKAIIEQIVQLQVEWMEEFAKQYPALAENARSIRTGDDNIDNTSYETYLRGEISTYSDKMLELYGRYVVEYAQNGKNLAFDIMTNSVHLYGYEGLDAAEEFTKKQFGTE